MTADSDDSIPELVEDGDLDDPSERQDDEEDEEDDDERGSLVDRLRGTGVGLEDPDIVGDAQPGIVDAEIAEDEPPVV